MKALQRVPAGFRDSALAYHAGEQPAVEPRGAATVALLRDGRSGPEVYLLRRHGAMAFAAGMYVFPGGTVDARDRDTAVAWAGPSPSEWASRLDCDSPALARALVCAAVRETFEESGVLLAGTSPDTVVADTTGTEWERDRAALVDRSLPFTDLLATRGLVLRTDLLAAWAHWITPEFEPRRYDTRFFVAAMPEGQVTRDVSGEADYVTWMRPGEAVRGADAGVLDMLAPTSVTLTELAALACSAEALAAAESRVIAPVLPTVEVVDGEPVLIGIPAPQTVPAADTSSSAGGE